MHEEPPVEGNLFTQPNDFSHADWTKNGVTVQPDDENGMDRMTEDSGGDFHFVSQTITDASDTTYILTVDGSESASSTRGRIALQLDDTAGNGTQKAFDLGDGTFSSANTFGTGFSFDDETVTDLTGGKWRFEATITTNGATTMRAMILLDAGDGTGAISVNYSGNGVQGALIDNASWVVA
jgi:hypothetical protein